MKLVQGVVSALVVMTMASSVQAKAIVYKCELRYDQPRGGISSPLYIKYDAATHEAVAYDGLIAHYNEKKPLAISVTTDNDRRTSFRWMVHGIDGTENGATSRRLVLSFGATIVKATEAINIYSSFEGADNSFSSFGTCAIE